MDKVLAIFSGFSFRPKSRAVRFMPAEGRGLGLKVQYFSYALLGAYILLLGSYLVGVNSYAAEGYAIARLQENITGLEEKSQKLTLKVSEQSSIAAVQASLENSEFVPVSQAKFLEVKYYTQK